jgi:hypothetical protein
VIASEQWTGIAGASPTLGALTEAGKKALARIPEEKYQHEARRVAVISHERRDRNDFRPCSALRYSAHHDLERIIR